MWFAIRGLRGERVDGECSGCGAAVKRCLDEENLIFCNVKKIKRINFAVKLLMFLPLPLIGLFILSFNLIITGGYNSAIQYGVMGGVLLMIFGIGYVTFCLTCGTGKGAVAKRSMIWRMGLWVSFFFSSGVALYLSFQLSTGVNLDFQNISDDSKFLKIILYLILPLGFVVYWACFLMRLGSLANRLNRKNTAYGAMLMAGLAVFMYAYLTYLVFNTYFFSMMVGREDIAGMIIGWCGLLILTYVLLVKFQIMLNHGIDWGKTIRPVVNFEGELAEQMPVSEGEMGLRIEFCCDGCGYNLMSVPLKGNCPECGHGIKQTLSDDNFMYSCSRWRKRLVMGLSLLILFPLMMMVLNYTLLAVGPWWEDRYNHYSEAVDTFDALVKSHEKLTESLNFGFAMVWVSFVVVFLTAKEPGAGLHSRHGKLRFVMWLVFGVSFVVCGTYLVTDKPFHFFRFTESFYWGLLFSIFMICLVKRMMDFSKRMHLEKLHSSGYSQLLIQGLIAVPCAICILDVQTGRHLMLMLSRAGVPEVYEMVTYSSNILTGLGFAHFIVYCVFHIIRISGSVNQGGIRCQFLPEGMGDEAKVVAE